MNKEDIPPCTQQSKIHVRGTLNKKGTDTNDSVLARRNLLMAGLDRIQNHQQQHGRTDNRVGEI